jgi:subtilase family serine protease
MQSGPRVVSLSFLAAAAVTAALFASPPSTSAQVALAAPAQANRIAANADLGVLTRLSGNIPTWARAQTASSENMDPLARRRVRIILTRSPKMQAAFDVLLRDQQQPGSPLYHQWLTPQQVGTLYGPTQADVAAVSAWAVSQGLQVDSVTASRMIVQLSASTATLGSVFHVSFGMFQVRGEPHVALLNEPSVPAALAPLIQAVDGLSDEIDYPVAPQPRLNVGGVHALLPADVAAIYDFASVYSGGNTGASTAGKPQHIAIVDDSSIATSDIADYAAKAGITNYTFNIIPLGGPGIMIAGSALLESTLDVERTVGTAPGAVTDLILDNNVGLYAAIQYNVETLLDPVMSISLGACSSTAGNPYDALFSAAAAEGITTLVSSGDDGANACQQPGATPPTTAQTPAINLFCDTAYVTCVGGTEFNDAASPSTYWSSTNSASGGSALGYIPEGAWNDPTYTTASGATVYQLLAGGGGVSQFVAKPTWQTGAGVPADGFRDVPDISLAASAAHDGYLFCNGAAGSPYSCEGGGLGAFIGGTSASAPTMAGIVALLNASTGTSQGNLNPLLYRLSATHPEAFHDITVATSGVTNCSVLTASMCNNTTASPASLSGGLQGYLLTSGYDLATGLGSLDVAKLLLASAVGGTATTLSVTATSSTVYVGSYTGMSATLTPATSSPTATGTIQFSVDGANYGLPQTLHNNTAASVTPSFTAAGTHTLAAFYSGDAVYNSSSAPELPITVIGQSFTIAASAPALTFAAGATSGNIETITLTSVGGFAGPVALTCSGPGTGGSGPVFSEPGTGPSGQPASCNLNVQTVTLTSGGTTTAIISIVSSATTVGQVREARRSVYAAGAAGLLAFLLSLLLFAKRNRSIPALAAMMLLLAVALTGASGCSGGGSNTPAQAGTGTPGTSGQFVFTIAGTSAKLSTTTTFTVSIQ